MLLSVPHTCGGGKGQGDGEQRRRADSVPVRTHAVEVVHAGGALRRLLARAPRLTVRIEFARLSTLTGEVGAGI